MAVRIVPLLMALALASPTFAQETQAQRDADRAMQDSIRQGQQYLQQQQQDALAARVQMLEEQRRTEENLRALQGAAQQPAPPPPLGPPVYALQNTRPLLAPSAMADTATAASPDAQAAVNAYSACLTEAARGLDDHISDAATIASAVEPSCQKQFQAWKDILDRGAASGARLAMDQSLSVSQQSTAVQAVLRARQLAPRGSR